LLSFCHELTWFDENGRQLVQAPTIASRRSRRESHNPFFIRERSSYNIFAFSRLYQIQATHAEKHRSFTFKNNIVIWDKGTLLAGPWDRININMDDNCYSRLDGDHSCKVIGKSWTDWQDLGRDLHSIIADPGFVDPAHRNFEFVRNDENEMTSPAFSIGFKPFDLNKPGLYGTDSWIAQSGS